MSDEAREWLKYAQENRQVSRLSLGQGLFNACLQNAQQAVEKALKAACVSKGLPVKKTHSVRELRNDLKRIGFEVGLEDTDCDLLDSIYLPSKYPLGSVLPDFAPDEVLARECLSMADRVVLEVERMVIPP